MLGIIAFRDWLNLRVDVSSMVHLKVSGLILYDTRALGICMYIYGVLLYRDTNCTYHVCAPFFFLCYGVLLLYRCNMSTYGFVFVLFFLGHCSFTLNHLLPPLV